MPAKRDAIGATLAQVVRPLARAGLYVPGGTARYPSSVLMTAIPAKVAGVPDVYVCSPGVKGTGEMDVWTLAACHVAGVSRLYRVGGAQAVAAMAHGTASMPAVDKICGPGNAYVAAAKRLVFGQVDIDMIAGPSEILVLADAAADPAEVASDLIAQAEHDTRAVSVLVTPSARLADATLAEVSGSSPICPGARSRGARSTTAARSWSRGTSPRRCGSRTRSRPEHLALHARNAPSLVGKLARGRGVRRKSTPEAVGDYLAGPSHVLPTAGTARVRLAALGRDVPAADERARARLARSPRLRRRWRRSRGRRGSRGTGARSRSGVVEDGRARRRGRRGGRPRSCRGGVPRRSARIPRSGRPEDAMRRVGARPSAAVASAAGRSRGRRRRPTSPSSSRSRRASRASRRGSPSSTTCSTRSRATAA